MKNPKVRNPEWLPWFQDAREEMDSLDLPTQPFLAYSCHSRGYRMAALLNASRLCSTQEEVEEQRGNAHTNPPALSRPLQHPCILRSLLGNLNRRLFAQWPELS